MKQQLLTFLAVIILLALIKIPFAPRKDVSTRTATTEASNPVAESKGYFERFMDRTKEKAQNTVDKVKDKVTTEKSEYRYAPEYRDDYKRRDASYTTYSERRVDRPTDNTYYPCDGSRYVYKYNKDNHAVRDLRLVDSNHRGLLGKSTANINLYNKGIYNHTYKEVDFVVESYDKYGELIGINYDSFSRPIRKGKALRKKVDISRNTDEIVVIMLGATGFDCEEQKESDYVDNGYEVDEGHSHYGDPDVGIHAQTCTCKHCYKKLEKQRKRAEKEVEKYYRDRRAICTTCGQDYDRK